MSLPPLADRCHPHPGRAARAAVLALGLATGMPPAAALAEAFGDWRLDCATREACRLSVEGREEVTGEPRFTLALAASGQALALEFASRGPRPDDGRAMQWEVDGQLLHVLRPGEFALHGDVRNVDIPIAALGQTAVLYALPCTVSGRTVTYRLYLRDTGEIGGLETLFFALHDPRFGWIGTDLLANVGFDDVSRTLRADYAGPSDRTCGYRAAWSWQDHAFRLESFEGPGDCRDAGNPGRWQRHHPR